MTSFRIIFSKEVFLLKRDMLQNRIISIHQEKRVDHYEMKEPEFHDDYEIYYLLSGERNYFIEDRTYHITSGDLVLINKHDLHRTFEAGNNPKYERILVSFGDAFLRLFHPFQLHDEHIVDFMISVFSRGIKRVHLNVQQQLAIESILSHMLQEQEHKHTGHTSYMYTLAAQLFIFIGRCAESSQEKSNIAIHPASRKMQDIIDFINENFHKEITVSETAERFHYNPQYLSRMFKKLNGFSFVEYLNLIRIKHAQRLLRDTDEHVIRIAEQVGFGHISHFGRVFRSVTKVSPTEYRKISNVN